MLVHHREDEAVHRQTVVVRQKSVEAMDQRLAFQGLINTITQLDDQLETLQAELELALTHIDEQGALQQLKFFNGLETHVVASVPNL